MAFGADCYKGGFTCSPATQIYSRYWMQASVFLLVQSLLENVPVLS